jgi:Kef-type K+ transport system membrane component KefB
MIFLMVVAIAGKLFEVINIPSLVGEITVGMLLGPRLADFVPFAEALVMIGYLGLITMMLEFGIEVDVAQLKLTGVRCAVAAVCGAMVAFGVAWGMAAGFGVDVNTGFALGASFAPTSTGIAANVLSNGGLLNTPVGQFVVTAGIFDDTVGLILLAELQAMASPQDTVWQYIAPIVSAVAWVVVLGYSAITWLPIFITNYIFPLFPKPNRASVGYCLMLLLSLAYMCAMNYTKASYLTGAFLAGLTFSEVSVVHTAFVKRTRNLFDWMTRIFFAAAIGFQVPVRMFANPNVIGAGFLLFIPVMSKMFMGIFLPRNKGDRPEGYPFNPNVRDSLITGLALTCRGEMNFIIGAFGVQAQMFTKEVYASMVWAVLLSTVVCPIALQTVVAYYNRLESKYIAETLPQWHYEDGRVPLYLSVQSRSMVSMGLYQKYKETVQGLGLKVIDYRSWHPRGFVVTLVIEMYVQDTKVSLHSANEVTAEGGEVFNLNSEEQAIIDKRCDEIQAGKYGTALSSTLLCR